MIQTVYPFDAYAIINGKRFNADGDGVIAFDLPAGKYDMTVSCQKSCIKQKKTVVVSSKNTKPEHIVLEWKGASLKVNSANGDDVFFYYAKLDDKGTFMGDAKPLLPGQAIPVKGPDFDSAGTPVSFEIYSIPKGKDLKGFKKSELDRVKKTSTRESLRPGEKKRIEL